MTKLTTTHLNRMTTNEDWEGFGYIGERENQFTGMHSGERDADTTAIIHQADLMLLESANRQGMTEDQLFAWANSKHGRWYGDCWFGANGQHAEKYLPVI